METNHVKLIDRYLNNDLTRAQQMEFEHRLTDLGFREKLMEQARLMDSQQEVFEDQIKNDIIHGASLIENNNSSKNFFQKHWQKLVGSLGLILGLLFLNHLVLDQKRTEAIDVFYADNFMHMPADFTLRGNEEDVFEPSYYLAMENLGRGQYRMAINNFDKQSKVLESSDLYKALCYGMLDNVQVSIDLHLPLLSSKSNVIRQNAEWYFLVNMLHEEQLTVKDGLLQKLLSNEEHLFHEWAKRLQIKLGEI